MNEFTDTFGRRLPKQRAWRDIPTVEPVTVSPVDVTDPVQFPEIAAAIDWARKQREENGRG